jgi:hypothetical protein
MERVRELFDRGHYLRAATLLERLEQRSRLGVKTSFAGRVYFNGSLQALRRGDCDRARGLARAATRFVDTQGGIPNQAWSDTLQSHAGCRNSFLQLAAREMNFK